MMRTLAPSVAAMFAVLALAGGCSSSSPNQPTGVSSNLPAGTTPGGASKTADTVDKLTLKGRVTDAQTGAGISKVTLLVVQEAVAPPEAPAPGSGLPSPDLGASQSASASLPAPGTPPAQPVASADATASADAKLDKPLEVTADKSGEFEVRDLPPGSYAITAYKRGYEAVTFQGGRPASGQLDLMLIPNGDPSGYQITGKVMLLDHKPAVGVHVAAALAPGLFAAQPAITDADGSFTLAGLPSGSLTVAAWQNGEPGEIKAWGFVKDVAVAMGKDKRSSHPEISLRAVVHPIILAGKVSASETTLKPRQVQVFLETDASADIPILNHAPDRDGYYRFAVPAPEEGTNYHILASGLDAPGDASYAHLHALAGPSHDDDLGLPSLPATPSLHVGAHTSWTWAPLPDVSAYRLRVESTGDDAKTLWVGWTTGTSISFPDISGMELSKGESYRYSLTVIKTSGAFELPEIALTPWAAASSLAPVEFVAGQKPKVPEAVDSAPTLREEQAAPPAVAPPQAAPPPTTRRGPAAVSGGRPAAPSIPKAPGALAGGPRK